VPAQPPKKQAQAMRWVEHLRAQPHEKQVQTMRRVEHLRAQTPQKQVRAVRRLEICEHNRQKKQVQAVRRVEHFRAQPSKEDAIHQPRKKQLQAEHNHQKSRDCRRRTCSCEPDKGALWQNLRDFAF